MNPAAVFLDPVQHMATESHESIENAIARVTGRPESSLEVGDDLQSDFRNELSDDEREAHIRDLGRLIQKSMDDYYVTNCFTYRGDADRYKLLMYAAIRGRSPAQVDKMRREQAGRMAREPGGAH